MGNKWRPEGWINPQKKIIHDIADSLLEEPSVNRQAQLRLHQCESLSFEAGADAMYESLKKESSVDVFGHPHSMVTCPALSTIVQNRDGILIFIPDDEVKE